MEQANQNNQPTINQLIYDTLIIGSGIAGMTAAIYAIRSGLTIAMIDASAPGGQLNKISIIENFPGFASIDGPTLAYQTFEQTMKLGVPYIYGKVLNITIDGDYKLVHMEHEVLKTKTVIIASGRKAKHLGLENEDKLTGRGISWCAICDGALYKDKDVAIVGGGNSALEGAMYLEKTAKSITLIHRRDELRGEEVLQEKVLNNPKIKVVFNSVITKINEENDLLSSIEIENLVSKETNTVKIDGLFIYIGFEPAVDLYSQLGLDLNAGYIKVDQNMKTNIKGVYACGDAIDKNFYQLVTAAGEGALAAHGVLMELGSDLKV